MDYTDGFVYFFFFIYFNIINLDHLFIFFTVRKYYLDIFLTTQIRNRKLMLYLK
jgi:hypothetical protein